MKAAARQNDLDVLPSASGYHVPGATTVTDKLGHWCDIWVHAAGEDLATLFPSAVIAPGRREIRLPTSFFQTPE